MSRIDSNASPSGEGLAPIFRASEAEQQRNAALYLRRDLCMETPEVKAFHTRCNERGCNWWTVALTVEQRSGVFGTMRCLLDEADAQKVAA